MMRRLTKLRVTRLLAGIVGLGLLLGSPRFLRAYEPETHEEISLKAVDRSRVNAILKSQYAVGGGVSQLAAGKAIQRWIQDGANQEDVPFTRALNHFHNPLLPWDQAGLTIGLQVGQSSVLWQQNPDQRDVLGLFFEDTWSWPIARTRFLDFLTQPNPADRERALADTARALGQMMHLIQDATVPAHVRNDPHVVFDGYEARMEEMRANQDPAIRARFQSLLSLPSVFPSPTIYTLTDDPAPVPIARLLDSDTFSGNDIATYTTGGQIGVAEYTNGGYVSDDTIFLDFAFPRPESLGSAFCEPAPCIDGARRYFPKVAEGDSVLHFVARGTLQERLRFRGQDHPAGYMLDDRTYEAAGAKLLPRAIGYSAALLDYFFRGQFSADPVPAGSSAQLAFDLRHQTPGEEFAGTVTIYYDNTAGQRVPVTGLTPASLTFTAAAPVARVTFTRPTDNPSDEYVIVLTGRLGQDEPAPGNPAGAIMARVARAARQTTPVATSAALAPAPDGSLILVWQQLDSGGRRLIYNRIAPDGSDVVAPVSIFAFGPGSFLHPPVNLAVGPDGHAHLAFKQAFSTGPTRIRYLRIELDGVVLASTIAAGTVETAVGAASLAVNPTTGLPSIVYFERQDLEPVTPLRIRAVHLDASGNQVGPRDFLLRFGAGVGANDFDVGTTVTIDAAGALSAAWIAKIGVANVGDTGYNLYVPGPSPTSPIRLTEGALRNQVLFDLFHAPVHRIAPAGTLHLAWSHKIGGRPAVFYGTRPVGGTAFTLAGEIPATPSTDSRRPHFVLPAPTRTVLTWTHDFNEVALAEFDSSRPGFPTTRAATDISNTAALSTDSAVALTVDPLDGTERRALAYIDASEGGNNVYLQFYSPLILDVTPNPARPEQAVTITGKGFGAAPLTEGRVTLNGAPLSVGSWSDTAITVNLPTGATSGPLVVEAQDTKSPEVTMEVLP
jgi:hypothetical protein